MNTSEQTKREALAEIYATSPNAFIAFLRILLYRMKRGLKKEND